MIEVLYLFQEEMVFEQCGAALSRAQGVFVIGDDGAGLGGQGWVHASGKLVGFSAVTD